MPDPLKFFVPGIPTPKGSTKSFWNPKAKKIVTLGANDNQKAWQSLVSLRAHEMGIKPTGNPISLELCFHLPRPKGHYNKAGNLRDAAPRHHTKKPDIDKIVRSILDSLTGIVYHDDSQVFVVSAQKSYVYRQDEQPGVQIVIQ